MQNNNPTFMATIHIYLYLNYWVKNEQKYVLNEL